LMLILQFCLCYMSSWLFPLHIPTWILTKFLISLYLLRVLTTSASYTMQLLKLYYMKIINSELADNILFSILVCSAYKQTNCRLKCYRLMYKHCGSSSRRFNEARPNSKAYHWKLS
jgi:hypothetical protein